MEIKKFSPYRNRRLLNLAHRVNECMMRSPVCKGVSLHGCEPIHSDFSEHGKGMGIKAADDQHVAGCHDCHLWFGEKRMQRDALLAFFNAARERTFAYYRKCKWLSKIGYADKGDKNG
jgi:hypothetical protein